MESGGEASVESGAGMRCVRALRGKQGQVRIAYYGDSSIEGDLICQSFRDSLQRRFGGKGAGFVPVMTHIPGFRRSIRQSASNNWYRNLIGQKNPQHYSRGISGEFFLPLHPTPMPDTIHKDSLPPPLDNRHWAGYRPSRWFPETGDFHSARLFYGCPPGDSTGQAMGSIRVSVDQNTQNFTLQSRGPVNELVVADTFCERIRIDFQLPSDFPVYGLSIETDTGIIVDNFSARGSDGGSLRSIDKNVLSEFQERLNYDLIILQFGLNVLNPRLKDYSWYQKKMEALIRHFQEAMPGVPVLVVGLSDKGTRINGLMQTDPSVPRITEAQRKAAQQTGAAFFSMYEAMGGDGTMVDWVENKKLAAKDYTHFNFTGARKAGNFLLDYLLGAYEVYQKHGPIPEIFIPEGG